MPFCQTRRPTRTRRSSTGCSRRPQYGERWARPWLDLARYADTNGYEKDNRRSIWKYRDWVIDALNRDLPFDQFTIEQIAGDMLPNATIDQKIASGFHRNAMTNEEGGVDPEESLYEVLVDRANTTATVWLGTTLACAQCHNHKYDPFTQKDYYRLLAFFANTEYVSTTFGDGTRFAEPRLDLATAEEEKTRQRMQADIDRLDQELKAVTPEVRDAQEQWEQSMRAAQTTWTPLAPGEVHATGGVVLKPLADDSVLASGDNAALTSYTVTATTTLQGITGLRIEALPDPSLPKGGPGRDGYGHFRVTGIQVEIAPLDPARGALSESRRAPATAGTDRRQTVAFKTIKVDDSAYAFDPAELLGAGEPSQYRKGGSWAINAMRDTDRVPRQGVLAAEAPFGFPEGTRITVRLHHLDGTIGQGIGRFRLSVTTRRRSARWSRPPRASSARSGAPECGAHSGAGRRPCDGVPIDRAAAEAAARRARRGPEGAHRPPDSLHPRDEGAVLVRAAVVRAAHAWKFHGEGRTRLRRHAVRAASDARRSARQPARARPLAG